MAYRVDFEEYMRLLTVAVPDYYREGTWHPEDMAFVVATTNDVLEKILSSLENK